MIDFDLPRTDAGRALLELLHPVHAMSRRQMTRYILAIEAEMIDRLVAVSAFPSAYNEPKEGADDTS